MTMINPEDEPKIGLTERGERARGSGDLSTLFNGPTGSTPWKPAGGRIDRFAYDTDRVKEFVRERPEPQEVDLRYLHSMQDGVTRHGVRHYMEKPDELYADKHQAGNRVPVVYHREDDDRHMILSGHHRATAALLQDRQFNAIVVPGGYGKPFNR